MQRGIRLLEASRERLQWEFRNLPSTGPLDLEVSEWNGATREVLLRTERLERQISLVQDQFAIVQVQRSALREKTKGLNLPLSLAKFQHAQEEMQRYDCPSHCTPNSCGPAFHGRSKLACKARERSLCESILRPTAFHGDALYFFIAASKAMSEGEKLTLRTNCKDSLAPNSLSIPLSSHSTDKGPL